jgi:ATP-dependent helicase HrpB
VVAQVALPIDALVPEIVRALRATNALVLEAPPGAGKTTRVPRALLEAGVAGQGELVVLQPRRLATRLAASRVADELGEKVGDTVGYQVRFEDLSGPKTRLRFVTEGVLGRRLLSDPSLRGVSVVVLDEFHERHLAGDVALAMLRQLQQTTRRELKLVVMSATLDADPIAAYLGGCPKLRSEGRRFEVAIEHLAAADDRHLDEQVLAAVKRLTAAGLDGDILVFLPGATEIRRARDACDDFATRHGFEVHVLHGDLPNADQDRAVRPGKRRKLILSTNVAETSVTIEGVAAVIDSGLARVAAHSAWSGLPSLKLAKVSKASATQRAGRAGRTRAGTCVRLYTRSDFEGRPEHETPEILRVDLAETALALRAGGVADLSAFPFFEPPAPSSLEAADELLRRLGAVDAAGAVTDVGRRLLRFPLHPRQARLIVEAERRGVGAQGALVAAMLGERDLRLEARATFRSGGAASRALSGPSDLLEMLDRFEQAEEAHFAHGRLQSLGLDTGATMAVDRVRRELTRLVDRSKPRPPSAEAVEDALCLAVLAGYPDRVAKRKVANAPELLLFGGGSATLSETSVVHGPELMVAVDAEERPRAPGRPGGVLVRLASKVEPEWLLDLGAQALREEDRLEWNSSARRVDRVTRLAYGDLVLEESRAPAPAGAETSRVLAEAAVSAGVGRFAALEAIEQWSARIELLSQAFPEAGFAKVDDAALRAALVALCDGLRSFSELEEAQFLSALASRLSAEQSRLLATMLPERVGLPGGRQVKVSYERGKPPWIESRLQDFFGMAKGPAVCGGRVPLVLHLLAPNQRAVQVTTDLAGFWERHYAGIRKELCRKYPRHPWPDDPLHAQPPPPRPPRPPRR